MLFVLCILVTFSSTTLEITANARQGRELFMKIFGQQQQLAEKTAPNGTACTSGSCADCGISLRLSKSNSKNLNIQLANDCERKISPTEQKHREPSCASCGKQAEPATAKIVNGVNAFAGQYPFMVSLRRKLSFEHFCGGTLVSARHVLTAAHCLESVEDPADIYVLSGTISYSSSGDKHDVSELRVHRKYVGRKNFWQDDIAVLKLKERVTFRGFRKPVRLASENTSVGQTCTVLGWGSTHPTQYVSPNVLQTLPQVIMDPSSCKTEYTYVARIVNKHVCGILERGYGVCLGDGGGPMICGKEQHGVASFTLNCNQGYPNVYTRISLYTNWIKSMTRDVDSA